MKMTTKTPAILLVSLLIIPGAAADPVPEPDPQQIAHDIAQFIRSEVPLAGDPVAEVIEYVLEIYSELDAGFLCVAAAVTQIDLGDPDAALVFVYNNIQGEQWTVAPVAPATSPGKVRDFYIKTIAVSVGALTPCEIDEEDEGTHAWLVVTPDLYKIGHANDWVDWLLL